MLFDVRDAPDHPTGQARAAAFIEQYKAKLPSLHHKSIRTTNLVERGFEEERRRATVIPKSRTEKECLKLVFATLWRASQR
ncbi:MAG TPA: hypothetical protein VGI81_00695 [Tepidisphaeraceae bacterium]